MTFPTSAGVRPTACPIVAGMTRALPQFGTLFGEADLHRTLVVRLALAPDQAVSLQALQQRRQGAVVELQELAQRFDGQRTVFPQHQHDQVLRIGQVELFQQRPVAVGQGPLRRVQGETHLVVEEQADLVSLRRWLLDGGLVLTHRNSSHIILAH